MKAPPLNPQKYEYDSVRGIGDGSLQSACQILNGIYNAINRTCLPKYKGKACPAEQIVTSVAADGNISCAPLYNGKCNPQTQVMTGINTSGVAQCGLKAQSANCPTACVGGWGACTKTCGSGKQTYVVITPATNGGAACIAPAPGTEQDCNTGACSEDCVGSWGACTQACGGGIKTYTVTQPKSGTGAACQNSHGDSIPCNTQACGPNTDCGGNWSSCNPVTGTKTFTITQAPQGSGAACPLPLTEKCSVDCVGSWGACSGGPPAYRTYNWTTPPLNGGSAATCQYPNGRTDAAACAGSIDCSGTWNSCDQITGTRTFNIIQLPQGVGAAACPSPLTQSCPVPCKGSWGNCAGGPPQYKTYTWTQLPLNGGSAAACEAGNGATDFAACAVPVPCLGDWSSCDKASGTTTFVVSQAPLNGGSVCPNPLTKSCPVACEGGWGVCAGGPPQVKTYTWTVQPLNGGAKCSVKDGEQDTTACVTGPPPAPVQSASYVSRFLGCDWGTDTWFVYTSATTGVLYFQKNDSCHNTFYKQTPYIYNGSAWVPSGPSTYTGGDLRGYCMKAC